MTNGLRAASERLRLCLKTELGTDGNPYTESAHRLDADLWAVAEAYLAEHPQDEDKSVTVEWLRITPLREDVTPNYAQFEIVESVRLVAEACPGGWRPCKLRVGSPSLVRGGDMTRGDVRRLCEILGVGLKETKVTK